MSPLFYVHTVVIHGSCWFYLFVFHSVTGLSTVFHRVLINTVPVNCYNLFLHGFIHSICLKLCIVYQSVRLVIHNCIAIVDKRRFRRAFLVPIISLQTDTISPPQPNNLSEAPTLYLHFFGSILPVERTRKFLVRNSWVMGVQSPCCLHSADYVGWSMACARIQGAKGLLFVANVVLLVLRSSPFAM